MQALSSSRRCVQVQRPFTAARAQPCAVRSVQTSARGEAAVAAPLTSENVKLRIRMRGFDIVLLREAVDSIRTVAEATGVDFHGPVMLPTRRKVYCVLRSPHVDKDAREHFEVRTHHRLVDLANLSSQAVEAMMQWVPPAGLEVECSIVAA